MTTTDVISPDLKTVLRRLKLSRMLDTLPERLTLARQQKMPHQDLLLQVLSDEVARRESLAVTLRVQKARLDPTMRLEAWDATAKVTFDRAPQRARLAAVSRCPCPRHHRRPRRCGQNLPRARARPHRLPTWRLGARRPYRPDAQKPEARASR